MKRNNRPEYLKPAFCFCEACTTYAFRLFVSERESAAECPNPDCIAVLGIVMTLNMQSLRIFAKNALCILELNVVSFMGFMKYVQ